MEQGYFEGASDSAKQLRVEQFLSKGLWYIGAGREKTRRALAQLLSLIPDSLFTHLLNEGRLFVMAPRRCAIEVATIRHQYGEPVAKFECVVVCIDATIEGMPYQEVLQSIAFELANALFTLSLGSGEEPPDISWLRPDEERPN